MFQFFWNVNLKKHTRASPSRKQMHCVSLGDINLRPGAVFTSLTTIFMVLLSLEHTWGLLARHFFRVWVTSQLKTSHEKAYYVWGKKKGKHKKKTLPGLESNPANFIPLWVMFIHGRFELLSLEATAYRKRISYSFWLCCCSIFLLHKRKNRLGMDNPKYLSNRVSPLILVVY